MPQIIMTVFVYLSIRKIEKLLARRGVYTTLIPICNELRRKKKFVISTSRNKCINPQQSQKQTSGRKEMIFAHPPSRHMIMSLNSPIIRLIQTPK